MRSEGNKSGDARTVGEAGAAGASTSVSSPEARPATTEWAQESAPPPALPPA